jgi:DNA-binding XRE family transcriptional regulator
MNRLTYLNDEDLTEKAKLFRTQAGKTRAQAARDMKVAQTSIFHAEESSHKSLARLRMQMIEAYSPYKVVGPVYFLTKK